MFEIGLLGAFVGGILTLLSPCSVMLLPAFFSYAFASPATLVTRAGVFYLGLVTTLVPLGLLAGSLGSLLTVHRSTVVLVAAGVLAVLGLLMVLGITIPGLPSGVAVRDTSMVSVFVLGTVYGFAGACTGPLLGAVLTVAAATGKALTGGLLLLTFAAGMTVPLLILAALWVRVPGVRALVRPRELRIGLLRTTWSGVVGGLLTIGVAVLLLLSDGTTQVGGILTATDQFRLESEVMAWTHEVSDALVVGVVLALVGGGWGVRRLMRRTRSHVTVEDEV